MATSNTASRTIVKNFNDYWDYWDYWDYLKENHENPEMALASNVWTNTSLPHTWNATDTVDAALGYRRSASWYKKTLRKPENAQHLHTKIYFEGKTLVTGRLRCILD